METSPPTDLDSLVQNTSREFSAFFKISSDSEGESIDENIEGVLARLDELYGMLDMIRNDNNVATDELLPTVREDLARLQPVFDQIDRLDEFVRMVKGNVMEVEKEVKLAEKEFSALSSIKKVVTSFPLFSFKKKDTAHRKAIPQSKYVPPKIFSTSEWFPKEDAKRNEEKDVEDSESSDRVKAEQNEQHEDNTSNSCDVALSES